jgi:DNA-binding transcriptional LysR family regulator
MTLQQLRYFKTLAKVQHYTKASQELFISQPSLSYSIAELEKELNISLFDKHGKKISLSAQGEVFLKYVDSSLRQLDEGIAKIKLLNPLKGKVNLGYIASLSSSFLPEVLKNFYKDESNSAITFNFVQKLNNALMESLKEGLIDLAFCPNPYKDVSYAPVMRQELYLIVPKGHPYASRKDIDIHEVKSEPFILTNKKSGLRHMISGIFKEMKISPKIAFEAEECNVAITFVSLNYGLSIIPRMSPLENSEVASIKIKNPEFSRIIYMAWMPSRSLPPIVKTVKDFIIDHYAISI